MKLTCQLLLVFTICLFVLYGCFLKKQEPTMWTNNGELFVILNPDSTYTEYEMEISDINYSAGTMEKERKDKARGTYTIKNDEISFKQVGFTNSLSHMEFISPMNISSGQMCYFDPVNGRICYDQR